MKGRKGVVQGVLLGAFLVFLLLSAMMDLELGKSVGRAFLQVLGQMMALLPPAFILIGLFEAWVRQETVIRHLGEESGWKGYLWVLMLAGISIGGLYVGLPMAKTLGEKGASLKVVFVYLGFVGVFRIPMTVFELSFMGLHFTLARWLVLAPLFLLSGILLGGFLQRRGYSLGGILTEPVRGENG